MSPNVCIAIATPTLRALLDFQSEQGSETDPASLADRAIREWLDQQRELARPAGLRGYFWKALFLPEGTRLRISSHISTCYAAIVGDDLVYNAMTMSPNQFAQLAIGAVHNAWSAIYLQMPGQREWQQALRLRHAHEAQTRRTANRPAATPPVRQAVQPAAPARPVVPPEGVLLAPQLRRDAEERRKAYRRAEDLLLD